ncbi:MAG: hypothetical protein GY927_15455 [bacterium]|nr:hypothetical protein [bacterium]
MTHFTETAIPVREARVALWYWYHKQLVTLLTGVAVRSYGWDIAAHQAGVQFLQDTSIELYTVHLSDEQL